MKTKTKIISLSIAILLLLSVLAVGVYAAMSAGFTGSGNVVINMQKEVRMKVTYEGSDYENFDSAAPTSIPLAERSVSSTADTVSYQFELQNNSNDAVTLTYTGSVLISGSPDANFTFAAQYKTGAESFQDFAASLSIPTGETYTFVVNMTYSGSYFETKTGTITIGLNFATSP